MIEIATRSAFETWVEECRPPLVDKPLLGLAALMTSAAFVAPVRQVAIFDAIAAALAGGCDSAGRAALIAGALPFVTDGQPRVTLPRPLWDAFWDVAGMMPSAGVDPLAFTLSVVKMGTHYDDALLTRCEAALLEFECVHRLLAEPEIRLRTTDLEGHAEDSLATQLHDMLKTQGYDLEVIDADAVVLAGDYPAQNRTNRRILQLHDIWHLVGGYGFTGAGEIAISGFQMAQFGQNYSTRFLATVATLSALHLPPVAELMLAVAFDGWRHGRAAPPLLAVPWHERIIEPISSIRSTLGIEPFNSDAAQVMENTLT